MTIPNFDKIKNLGQLKKSGYKPQTIKEELRSNLIHKMKNGGEIFSGIIGYDYSVIPDLQRAILAQHNITLLGLRGQAKTRIARQMVDLLNEYIPVIDGSELNDDPLAPLSRYAKDQIAERGDETPVRWMHRSERYTEKLATPDVSIADLVGDVDPIKAAALKLPYSDERVIHFGLIPRSHRCIFVINELPDLQARIQVALFNILQERDVQIRGFKIRLPLDILFVFTANPEDYTNRGAIVTPLKDRIESQILTHYPKSIMDSRMITEQEARIHEESKTKVKVHDFIKDLVEQISFEARESEYIDSKSGVSARLSISAYENLISSAERRLLLNNENSTTVRISDLNGIIPAITGKVELVYEGEQEGSLKVAHSLIGKAIRVQFLRFFPDPEKMKRKQESSPYQKIVNWFGEGNSVDLLTDVPRGNYEKTLNSVPGLQDLVKEYHPDADRDTTYLLMEFVLFGLAEYSFLSKYLLDTGYQFKDLLSSMLTISEEDDEENEADSF
ncbi:MAG: magnesium chelatase [Calditrichaeota bacterium]|nr:magnesium chelatase [Calditrichota bacterium]RQW02098.1 MAG: magnesium chelatase [Calditrichota bacterium]